ncbi:MAG TPA: hypothetical protein ENK46_07575 [Flavobacteriia bacterium]|nr:hypothetical protein [Flavobacteriia bacterium]
MMKKVYFTLLFTFSFITSNAQLDISYGIKGGLNFSSSGDLNLVGGLQIPEAPITFFKDNREIGFDIGVYAQMDISKIFIRTELLFSQLNSSYSLNQSNDSEYSNSRLKLPVLLGYKVFKPFSLYAGPSLEYHLNNTLDAFDNVDLNIDKDLAFAFNIGGLFEIKRFGIDVRYSSNLSKNNAINLDATIVDGVGYNLDTKSNQFTLGISYKLN